LVVAKIKKLLKNRNIWGATLTTIALLAFTVQALGMTVEKHNQVLGFDGRFHETHGRSLSRCRT